jgi:hypothetical protein
MNSTVTLIKSVAALSMPFFLSGLLANSVSQYKLEPGNWEITIVYEKFELAGVSQADIKKHMKPLDVVNMCITQEIADSPYFGVGAALDGCTLDRKDLGEGKFSSKLVCESVGSVSTASGTLRSSTIEYVGTRESKGPNASSARTRVTGRRIGPC